MFLNFFSSSHFSIKKNFSIQMDSLLLLILGKIHFKVFPWFSIYLYRLYVSYWKFHNISTSFVGSLKQETRVVFFCLFKLDFSSLHCCLHLRNNNQNSNEFWLKKPKSIWFDFSCDCFCSSSSWCLKRKTFFLFHLSLFYKKIFEIISRLFCV